MGIGSRQTGIRVFPFPTVLSGLLEERVNIKAKHKPTHSNGSVNISNHITVTMTLPFLLDFYLYLPKRKLSGFQPPDVGA